MLPETLLCLLNAAFVLAQTRQSLPLNQATPFTPSNLPNPPTFSIPSADTLSISIALCTTNGSPRFFVTNSSTIDDPGPGGGKDVFEIPISSGYGNWTGFFKDGGTLSVMNPGQTSFELAVTDNNDHPIHEVVASPPVLGDTTSTHAIIFSTAFDKPLIQPPTYPNYTLPPANQSAPSPPSSAPNFTLIISTTSSNSLLTALPQTGCSLLKQKSLGRIANQTFWMKDQEGWRAQWLMEALTPSTNYTAYVVQGSTKVSGPMFFTTKSAAFPCSLVHSLPYCPNIAYSVPLPQPPSGSIAYDATNIPTQITTPLLSYMTNFTTSLTTFACGRDWYSPIVGCNDCQREYRRWLCAITFTRCGEPSPTNPDSFTAVPPAPNSTGLSAVRPTNVADGSQPQQVFSALVAQSTDISKARSPTLPAMGNPYNMLLPCLERCTAVDRACPNFLGFTCPDVRFNAAASYGVGYVDSIDDDEGRGVTGTAQDRWGNIWCNGA